jgi:hypothetical protein
MNRYSTVLLICGVSLVLDDGGGESQINKRCNVVDFDQLTKNAVLRSTTNLVI